MPTTTLFWAIALALVVATLAALVVPLVRSRSARERPADDDAAAAVYRDQKRQLDADVASGAMTAGERDATQSEIVTRFGAELASAAPSRGAAGTRAAWIAAISIVAIVPAVALISYLSIGQPGAIGADVARKRASDAEIVAMVERLAQRMKEQPADPQGWLLLGRSWNALQRYPEAANAYEQAARRLPGNADALADWADALAMAQGRKLAGRPTEIVGQALAADPAHPKALALAASAATERGDDKTAARYWRALLAIVPPGSEDALAIRSTIAQLEGQAPSVPAPAGARPAAMAPGSVAGRIAGRVDVAPALASRVPPDATLFVYARAPQGPRVPLAVLRRAARELPVDFVLDDSMAMAPGATLSGTSQVVVEARISASGNASPATGDLSGSSGPVAPGTAGLVITIDRVVP